VVLLWGKDQALLKTYLLIESVYPRESPFPLIIQQSTDERLLPQNLLIFITYCIYGTLKGLTVPSFSDPTHKGKGLHGAHTKERRILGVWLRIPYITSTILDLSD
jgi:hypothetical protein